MESVDYQTSSDWLRTGPLKKGILLQTPIITNNNNQIEKATVVKYDETASR